MDTRKQRKKKAIISPLFVETRLLKAYTSFQWFHFVVSVLKWSNILPSRHTAVFLLLLRSVVQSSAVEQK